MSQPTSPSPAGAKSAGELMVAYFRDFGVLKETRKEYWGIQVVNFLDCTFYFALLTIATVFLSEDLGLNDRWAGYSTAVFTSATSLMLFVSGMYTDWLGIRRSLILRWRRCWCCGWACWWWGWPRACRTGG